MSLSKFLNHYFGTFYDFFFFLYDCSQTFVPEDADQKMDHHWSKLFVDATNRPRSLLKCVLAKRYFPRDSMKKNMKRLNAKRPGPDLKQV